MTNPNVRSARKEEIAAVGALVALSFNDLDADAYLAPAPAEHQRVCSGYVTLLTEHSFDHGRIDIIEGASTFPRPACGSIAPATCQIRTTTRVG